jgi:hypothetical protein
MRLFGPIAKRSTQMSACTLTLYLLMAVPDRLLRQGLEGRGKDGRGT